MKKSTKISRNTGQIIEWRSVGRRIRELRGFDTTQEEFARQIEVSQSYLSAMERGRKEIGAEILLKIARHFGKSLEWLLVGDDG
ncbi:MAG TPA: helix-turn-helix transcriptional regulator [Chthoniobacterales bacterium]|jgi:transcriptional regulator with XRE-family HTH domain